METARVQKPAEPAPAPQAKKAPFFPAAAVQPKMTVHKPESASSDSPARPPAMMPTIRPVRVKPTPETNEPAHKEGAFFKPAVSPATAVVRNLYQDNTAQPTAAQTHAAETALLVAKPEIGAKAAAPATPLIGITEKAGAQSGAAAGAALQSMPMHDTPQPEPAAKQAGDSAIQATSPASAEAPAGKTLEQMPPETSKPEGAPHEAAKPHAKGPKGVTESAGGEAGKASGGAQLKHLRPEKTEAVFQSKLHKAAKLAHNTAATRSAKEKIEESKAAQDTPKAELQSRSNEGQVTDFDSRKKAPKTEDEAKNTLDTAITQSVPSTLKEMDDFKENGKGKEVSAAVMTQVNGDVTDVKSGFEGMGTTPAPAPPEKGTDFPPTEEAAPVAQINMGHGVVPTIDKQELDTKHYTNQSDDIMKQEGVTQEQLDMVDSGDLANANKERKNLQKQVVAQPAEVQHMATQEHKKLESHMHTEESHSRTEMHGHRKEHLNKTQERQRKAKEELEKQRAEVAKNINDRYAACQKSIMGKLDKLEKASLAQFDQGQQRATTEFEDQVKTDIRKFKDKRYDRWGGSLLWLKDKLVGIADFPEVTEAFDRARKDYATKIDTLIATITKASNQVIADCKQELADTQEGIKKYVASLGPKLQDTAKKAEDEVDKKLKALGSEIDRRKQQMQQKLADKRKAAMEAIDKKIEAMKESLSGALSIIGKLLLKAALKFFKWALESAGLSADDIMGVIEKGVAVIKAIVTKPIAFVKNLISAAVLGFNNFGKNFLTHLKDAVFDWLTGALEGVNLPKVWDPKGVFFFVLDILGLNYPNIRRKMVNLMGEPAVIVLEKTFTLVKTLVTEGPAAAWEQLKDMADEVQAVFVNTIKEWIRNTIIFKAIETIVETFVPGAGIVKAIISIYDTVMFFIQKAKQIAQMVGGFLNSISDIVAGNIDGAAQALENGLATALLLVINFLARLLHLDGITDKIRKAIETIRGKVDKALDKVVLWIKNMAGKTVSKGKEVISNAVGWLKGLLGIEKKFDDEDGSSHRLYFAGQGDEVELMMNPGPAASFKTWINSVQTTNKTKDKKEKALGYAKLITEKRESKPPKNASKEEVKQWEYDNLKKIRDLVDKLSVEMKGLLSSAIPECATHKNKEVELAKKNKNGFGRKMTATYLTHKGLKNGTDPSGAEKNDTFEILNKRRYSTGGAYYVKGHLLSEKLGGTGDDWENLTPLTKTANRRHESLVESSVKKAVNDQKHVLLYTVEPQYGRGEVKEDKNAKSKNKNKDKADIMAQEEKVAISLHCTATAVTLDPANPKKIVAQAPLIDAKIDNDITDPPDY